MSTETLFRVAVLTALYAIVWLLVLIAQAVGA